MTNDQWQMTNAGGAASAAPPHHMIVVGAGLQSRPLRADLQVGPNARECEWRLQRLS